MSPTKLHLQTLESAFYVSFTFHKILFFTFFQSFKNFKTILTLLAKQNQATSSVRPELNHVL